MKLTIGFSPCPNDTYIFDALVNHGIDTGDLQFEVIMEDVQTLNELAIQGKLDVSKISYATLPLVLDQYRVLTSGGALGTGVGPLLISRIPVPEPAIRQCTIAIPGQNTTANLLFSLAFPEAINKVFLRYDQIEDFVQTSANSLNELQAVKLGVIIHENRFTYQKKQLQKVVDLGEFWETETGFPIPLGGVVIRKRYNEALQRKINGLVRSSIEAANKKDGELSSFVKQNAREMDESVMHEHINLYVNKYSVDLGVAGRNAVTKFLQVHSSINKLPVDYSDIFVL